MHPRKVIINALQDKADGSGISIMIRELFAGYTRMANANCEVIVSADNQSVYGGEHTKRIRVPIQDNQNLQRSIFLSLQMGLKYCRNAALLTSDAQIPLILPRSTQIFPVVTDLSMFRRPDDYRRSRVLLWKLQYYCLRRSAKGYFAISEFTKREMMDILKIPAEKIQVVYCACPAGIERVDDALKIRQIREKYHLPKDYILFVGNENKRKNLENLIAAFARIKRETDIPHELVIAGGASFRKDLSHQVSQAHYPGVRMVGYVAKEDLPALYTGADAFMYLSLYEGFGIPILEAQKCGTPVLAAQGSSLQEVGGDGVLYVNAQQPDEIFAGIRKILLDQELRDKLIHRGYENEKRFSWNESAKIIKNTLEKGF